MLEFATPDAGVTGALRDFPEDKLLGLGVIHPSDRNVESPVAVAGLVERAMEFVPKERITLNPNGGFTPGGGRRASKHGGVRRGVPEAWSHVSRRKAAAGAVRMNSAAIPHFAAERLLVSFFDDRVVEYFMVVNLVHGDKMSKMDGARTVRLTFDRSVTKIERLNRLTSLVETLRTTKGDDDTRMLDIQLNGGTGA